MGKAIACREGDQFEDRAHGGLGGEPVGDGLAYLRFSVIAQARESEQRSVGLSEVEELGSVTVFERLALGAADFLSCFVFERCENQVGVFIGRRNRWKNGQCVPAFAWDEDEFACFEAQIGFDDGTDPVVDDKVLQSLLQTFSYNFSMFTNQMIMKAVKQLQRL